MRTLVIYTTPHPWAARVVAEAVRGRYSLRTDVSQTPTGGYQVELTTDPDQRLRDEIRIFVYRLDMVLFHPTNLHLAF